MTWVAHGVPHPVGLDTWRTVCNIAPSYRVVVSAQRTHDQSATRCGTIAPHIRAVISAAVHSSAVLWRLSTQFAGHDNAVCLHVYQVPR
jgi:hypothetical protein